MIELPVLLKRLQSQLPIHLVQPPEERPHELHPSHVTQKLRGALVGRLVLGSQRDAVERRLELDVLGGDEVIGGAEEADALYGEGLLEALERLEEHEALAAVEGLDVRGRRGEGLARSVRWFRPENELWPKLTGSFHFSARA